MAESFRIELVERIEVKVDPALPVRLHKSLQATLDARVQRGITKGEALGIVKAFLVTMLERGELGFRPDEEGVRRLVDLKARKKPDPPVQTGDP